MRYIIQGFTDKQPVNIEKRHQVTCKHLITNKMTPNKRPKEHWKLTRQLGLMANEKTQKTVITKQTDNKQTTTVEYGTYRP